MSTQQSNSGKSRSLLSLVKKGFSKSKEGPSQHIADTKTSSREGSRRGNSGGKYVNDDWPYKSLAEVQQELHKAGLESSNLVIAIDFTKSNEWKGEVSFGGRSLHHIDASTRNPYEQALHSLCTALASFDDEQRYQCIGFGDVTTKDKAVFAFLPAGAPSGGLQGTLQRYRQIAPYVRMAGPTSFAACIREAMRLVVASNCQYHILLIIADGGVTSGLDVGSSAKTVQELETEQALVEASHLPLSIVCIGVGDGPWECVAEFDECMERCRLKNYHFINFTEAMEAANAANMTRSQREANLAMHALMKVPEQYKAIRRLGLLSSIPPQSVVNTVGPEPLPPPSTVPPPGRRSLQGIVLQPTRAPEPRESPFGQYSNTGWAPEDTGAHAGSSRGPTGAPGGPPSGLTAYTVSNAPASPTDSNRMPADSFFNTGSTRLPPGSPLASGGPTGSLGSHQSDMLSLRCPIKGMPMADPVMAGDGYMYERSAIMRHFQTQGCFSPVSRMPMANTTLIACNALRCGSATTQSPASSRVHSLGPATSFTSALNAAQRAFQRVSIPSDTAATSSTRAASATTSAEPRQGPSQGPQGPTIRFSNPATADAVPPAGGPVGGPAGAPVGGASTPRAFVAVNSGASNARSLQHASTSESFIGYDDLPSPTSAGTPARMDSGVGAPGGPSGPAGGPAGSTRGGARMWEFSLLSGNRERPGDGSSGHTSPTGTEASGFAGVRVPTAVPTDAGSVSARSLGTTEDLHISVSTAHAASSHHSAHSQAQSAHSYSARGGHASGAVQPGVACFAIRPDDADEVEVSPFEETNSGPVEDLGPFGSLAIPETLGPPQDPSFASLRSGLAGAGASGDAAGTVRSMQAGKKGSFKFLPGAFEQPIEQPNGGMRMLPFERRVAPAHPAMQCPGSLSEDLDVYAQKIAQQQAAAIESRQSEERTRTTSLHASSVIAGLVERKRPQSPRTSLENTAAIQQGPSTGPFQGPTGANNPSTDSLNRSASGNHVRWSHTAESSPRSSRSNLPADEAKRGMYDSYSPRGSPRGSSGVPSRTTSGRSPLRPSTGGPSGGPVGSAHEVLVERSGSGKSGTVTRLYLANSQTDSWTDVASSEGLDRFDSDVSPFESVPSITQQAPANPAMLRSGSVGHTANRSSGGTSVAGSTASSSFTAGGSSQAARTVQPTVNTSSGSRGPVGLLINDDSSQLSPFLSAAMSEKFQKGGAGGQQYGVQMQEGESGKQVSAFAAAAGETESMQKKSQGARVGVVKGGGVAVLSESDSMQESAFATAAEGASEKRTDLQESNSTDESAFAAAMLAGDATPQQSPTAVIPQSDSMDESAFAAALQPDSDLQPGDSMDESAFAAALQPDSDMQPGNSMDESAFAAALQPDSDLQPGNSMDESAFAGAFVPSDTEQHADAKGQAGAFADAQSDAEEHSAFADAILPEDSMDASAFAAFAGGVALDAWDGENGGKCDGKIDGEYGGKSGGKTGEKAGSQETVGEATGTGVSVGGQNVSPNVISGSGNAASGSNNKSQQGNNESGNKQSDLPGQPSWLANAMVPAESMGLSAFAAADFIPFDE